MNTIKRACVIINCVDLNANSNLLEYEHYRWTFEYVAAQYMSVTVLFVAKTEETENLSNSIQHFGFDIDSLYHHPTKVDYAAGIWGIGETSYRVYQYLLNNKYSHVFSIDSDGLFFYSCIAKSLGLALMNLKFITIALNPVIEKIFNSEENPTSIDVLAKAYMERRATELSDLVLTENNTRMRMLEGGYSLKNTIDLFDLNLSVEYSGKARLRDSEKIECIAIVISEVPLHVLKVLFLGLVRHYDEISCKLKVKLIFDSNHQNNNAKIIKSILTNAPFEYEFESYANLTELCKLVKRKRALCVLYDVFLSHREIAHIFISQEINFIFCCGEGHTVTQFENEFVTTPKSFTKKIVNTHSLHLIPESSIQKNSRLEIEGIGQTLNTHTLRQAVNSSVSVCVVHHQRPKYLRRVLESLADQRYENFEVIVVDDGSATKSVLLDFESIANQYTARGWKFFKKDNSWLGASRNFAASKATGEYLIFMDDDNIATPEFVSTYVRAIEYSNKDILTCFAGVFEENDCCSYENNVPEIKNIFLPLGGAMAIGCFYNLFGDAACIVKKKVFVKLGGFWQYYGLPKEDHDFYMRAVGEGFQLEVVPKQLFFYRKSTDGMMAASGNDSSFDYSVNRIFQKANIRNNSVSDWELRALLLLCVSNWKQRLNISKLVKNTKSTTRWKFSIMNRIIKIFRNQS